MKPVLLAAAFLLGMPVASWAQQAPSHPQPPLYRTRAEAEKAASRFHCTGAHPMGDQWMPCASHGDAHTSGH